MRHTTIILALLFFGCSKQQEQKDNHVSIDTLEKVTLEKSELILAETNNCDQTNLSNQFNISIDFKRYVDTVEIDQSCFLTVYIKDKLNKSMIDSFSITSPFYYSFMFLSCDSMTSYSTKFNSSRKGMDNYYGDIVVADLNFDGYDDIAVVNDGGGNAGPLYSYYLQNNNKKFTKDIFLTDTMEFFPSEINSKEYSLTTYVHAGACSIREHIYKLDKKGNIWMEISNKLINICEE